MYALFNEKGRQISKQHSTQEAVITEALEAKLIIFRPAVLFGDKEGFVGKDISVKESTTETNELYLVLKASHEKVHALTLELAKAKAMLQLACGDYEELELD